MSLPTSRIEMLPVAALKPYPGNSRRHSKEHGRQRPVALSLASRYFTVPSSVISFG
jgi:hypothetical protein